MSPTLKAVENIKIAAIDDDRIELSAVFAGEPLYYRVPKERFCREAIGDVLLLSVLAPAMREGWDIEIPEGYPVSMSLLANLELIQRVWKSWHYRLRKVAVKSGRYDPLAKEGDVGVFYAGGVDSSYSLLDRLDDIDAMVVVYGFDFTFTDEEIADSLELHRPFAENLGKELIPIESNHSQFVTNLGVGRGFIFGATLSAVALILGLRRCYIGSGHAAASLQPDGSHVVLDHLFSNGMTEIIHHDATVTRFEKTRAIATRPDFLKNLRVCWRGHHENCGKCSKCIRTMTALHILGIKDGPFPPLESMKQISDMVRTTSIAFVLELVVAAHDYGDAETLRALKKGIRHHDFMMILLSLDRLLLGGWLKRRKLRNAPLAHLVRPIARPDMDILRIYDEIVTYQPEIETTERKDG